VCKPKLQSVTSTFNGQAREDSRHARIRPHADSATHHQNTNHLTVPFPHTIYIFLTPNPILTLATLIPPNHTSSNAILMAPQMFLDSAKIKLVKVSLIFGSACSRIRVPRVFPLGPWRHPEPRGLGRNHMYTADRWSVPCQNVFCTLKIPLYLLTNRVVVIGFSNYLVTWGTPNFYSQQPPSHSQVPLWDILSASTLSSGSFRLQ